jgi:hypothetical protein
VTYYFTQKVLGQYPVEDTGEDTSWIDKEAVAFVKKYGAYLQIHSCLSCSAAVKAVAPINEILQLASHDPTHRDAVREIHKSTSLTFYDSVSVLAKKGILVHNTTHSIEYRNIGKAVSCFEFLEQHSKRKEDSATRSYPKRVCLCLPRCPTLASPEGLL